MQVHKICKLLREV